MTKVRIILDYSNGPIWKDKYNPQTGEWSTGVAIVDNDRELAIMNSAAEKIYASFFEFDGSGNFVFKKNSFLSGKNELDAVIQRIIQRLNFLNDGSYVVEKEDLMNGLL